MATSYTSNKKISGLDSITGSLSGTDLIVVEKGGDTLRATLDQVESKVFGSKPTGTIPQTGDTVVIRRGSQVLQLESQNLLPSGAITNTQVSALAAIAHNKLANITAGQVLMGNSGNVPTATALTGDVTINSSGVTAISSDVIVNADIKSDAAIAGTKIAPAFGSQNVSATGSIQSNGTGSSFSQINGGNADGAFVRLSRAGSATQNAYLAQFQGSLFIKNNDSGAIAFNTTTSDTERMRIDANGNVSVGTTATNFRTTSAHNSTDGAWLHGSSTSSYLGLGGYTGATDGSFRLNYNRSTGDITFNGGTRDTPVERIRIDNAGNVGIGVAPANKLDVLGGQYLRASTTESVGLDVGYGRTGSGFAYLDLIGDATYTDYGFRLIRGSGGANATSSIIHRGTGDLGISAQDAAAVVVYTNNTERMRIDASGNVGIGTSSPSQRLHLSSTAPLLAWTNTSFTRTWNLGSSGSSSFFLQDQTANTIPFAVQAGAPSDSIFVNSSGKVGIGTFSPAQELSVVGDITATAGVAAGTSLYTQNFVYVGGVQVIESRKTGWAAATGTATRTTFATSTVTTAQLAERVKALIDDLRSHGLIGN